jgi:hypothetical protein
MPWPTIAELDDLVARFSAATLPKAEWTHLAHLAVGTWHVRRYGPQGALVLLRAGITRLNGAHGTVNSDSSGYHETVTRAYVCLIAEFLATQPGVATADCVGALLASPLADRKALLRYYSEAALGSVSARRGWVEPDVAPLRHPLVRPARG